MTNLKAVVDETEVFQWLNTLTPVEVLTEANKGFKPRDIDLDLIKELQGQGFDDGVITVMLYFVLARSRGLRFDEVRTMAAAWQGQELTVDQAITMAEEAFLQWLNNKK